MPRHIKGSRIGHSVKASRWCVTLLININNLRNSAIQSEDIIFISRE